MDDEARKEQFLRIKKAYQERDEEMMRLGQLPMRSTEKGFWGVSNLDDVYEFFEEKDFSPDTRFIDLGCGDGRVVLVASLFVDASGVEVDAELVRTGQEIAQELGLDAQLWAGDILDVDLSGYDALYMYADQHFAAFKHKLLEELEGTLYLYHDTYHPRFLEKQKTFWAGQIPIYAYTAPTREE